MVYYLDAQVIADQAKSLNTAASPLVLGDGFDHRRGGDATVFGGLVDEVLLYNRALAASEVVDLCNQCGGKCGLDHFMFYKVKTAKGTVKFLKFGPVSLTDQFGTADYDVIRPRALGLPADKNGEGVVDDATHLKEYKINAAKGAPKFAGLSDVLIQNQCNDLLFDVKKPVSLLVPSTKFLQDPLPPPPSDEHVDHFLCYKMKPTKKLAGGTKLPKFPKGIQVEVSDQFQTRRYDLKKITKLCNPVAKSGNPVFLSGPQKGASKPITPSLIRHPEDHLVCYKAQSAKKQISQDGCGCDTSVDPRCKGAKIEPKQPKHLKRIGIVTNNQFGPETLKMIEEVELCIPSLKDHDTTSPNIVSLTPPDEATNFPPNGNLVVQFDGNVQKGTGNIVIKLSSDDSVVESIDVTTSLVTVSGDTITINTIVDLVPGTAYYVEIDAGAIKDLSGNSFGGISDKTTWNFTTS